MHKKEKKKKGPVGPEKEEEEEKLETFFGKIYEFHNPVPVAPVFYSGGITATLCY